MLSSHRAACVPKSGFYKMHCLVAQHMAEEFVALFKNLLFIWLCLCVAGGNSKLFLASVSFSVK